MDSGSARDEVTSPLHYHATYPYAAQPHTQYLQMLHVGAKRVQWRVGMQTSTLAFPPFPSLEYPPLQCPQSRHHPTDTASGIPTGQNPLGWPGRAAGLVRHCTKRFSAWLWAHHYSSVISAFDFSKKLDVHLLPEASSRVSEMEDYSCSIPASQNTSRCDQRSSTAPSVDLIILASVRVLGTDANCNSNILEQCGFFKKKLI